MSQAELHLLHVFHTEPSAERSRDLAGHLRAYVNEKAAFLKGLEGLTVGIHLRAGKPVREIVQLATEVRADLIVVGSHKGPHLRQWIVGSTAEKLIAAAPCPVLVASPKPKEPAKLEPSNRTGVSAVRADAEGERRDDVVVRTPLARRKRSAHLFVPARDSFRIARLGDLSHGGRLLTDGPRGQSPKSSMPSAIVSASVSLLSPRFWPVDSRRAGGRPSAGTGIAAFASRRGPDEAKKEQGRP